MNAKQNIGKTVELTQGTKCWDIQLSDVNHWDGGNHSRDYLEIDEWPLADEPFVDHNKNARLRPALDVPVETDAGLVILRGAGSVSGTKQDELKRAMQALMAE